MEIKKCLPKIKQNPPVSSMFNLLVFLLVSFAIQNGFAEVNPLGMQILKFPDYGYNFNPRPDIGKVIPLDLKPGTDQGQVASVIADRSIQLWLDTPEMRSSPIVGTAAAMQEKMKADISLGQQEGKTQHRFTFEYLLAQATAQVKYSGWARAVYRYETMARSSQIELTEKIFKKDFFVNHRIDASQGVSTSLVGLRLNW